jgi:molybdate transport system substrate-binding protein
MLKSTLTALALLPLVLYLPACNGGSGDSGEAAQPELLFYCGITMVKPMREIADAFERDNACKVIMSQGGSEDLYQSLKLSQQGDLYLPGSESYRKKHLPEGLLGDCVYVGFNQASFLVPKGNPKKITGDLKWLLDESLAVVIGNSEVCSVGRQAEKILSEAKIWDQVVANCFSLAADSRNLNKLIKDGTADLMINWRATAFFEENRDFIDVIDLDESVSPRKKLLLNQLTFSRHPDLARRFMDYAASPAGRTVFRRFGFLEEETSLMSEAAIDS